jgi:hypothetical protein
MLREIVVTRQDEDKRNVTEINTILTEYNKKMIQSAKIKLHELKGNLMSNLSPALSRTKYRVSKTSKSSDTVDSSLWLVLLCFMKIGSKNKINRLLYILNILLYYIILLYHYKKNYDIMYVLINTLTGTKNDSPRDTLNFK